MITCTPETHEIDEAVIGLSAESSPGQDGYTGYLNIKCWDTIKDDLREVVQGFFKGDHLHKGISTTLLVLIPKIVDPTHLSQFRPISLSNFVSKIITKIIATRMAKVLPQVISEEQTGFVKGRNMNESIALAQELVRDIDRKAEGGNVIFKFDMSKAYDRLEWSFRALEHVVLWVFLMVSVTSFIDRSPIFGTLFWLMVAPTGISNQVEVFAKGCIAPILFIMAQQLLSHNLKKLHAEGKTKPYVLGRNIETVTHLFYADDMLIFTNASKRSIEHLFQLIRRYELSSGQQLSLEKSSFYPSKRLNIIKTQQLSQWSGCVKKQLPFMYLGVPVYKGRCLIIHFEHLIQKIKARLAGWQSQFLSFGG